MRGHTGERPYISSDCNKTDVTRGALNAHNVIHSRVKPYGCKLCPSMFYYLFGLRQHMLSTQRKGDFLAIHVMRRYVKRKR